MDALILRLPKATSSIRIALLMLVIVGAPMIALGAWLVSTAATATGPRWLLFLLAGMLFAGVALFLCFIARALIRRRGVRAMWRRGLTGAANDEEIATALAVLGGCGAYGAWFLRRRRVDAFEERTGRKLPRVWVFGEEVAGQLRRLCDTELSDPANVDMVSGAPLYRAYTKPSPPHMKWMAVAIVAAAVGGVFLMRHVGGRGIEVLVYGVFIGGVVACRLLIDKGGWWVRPMEGQQLELVRKSLRGRVVETRRIEDDDPIVIIYRKKVGGLGGQLIKDAIGWRLLLSDGQRIEVEDMDPVFTPWAGLFVGPDGSQGPGGTEPSLSRCME